MTYGIKHSIIDFKDSKMAISGSTEDMDFCCSSEEYYENDEIHSPTDSSEDSVEVKISPILSKNKRKCAEPRKVQDTFTGPLKKRMCLKVKAEVNETQPFRPWSPPATATTLKSAVAASVPPIKSDEDVKPFATSASFRVPLPLPPFLLQNTVPEMPPVASYFRPPSPIKFYQQQTEPVSLVKRKDVPEPSSSSSSSDVNIKKELLEDAAESSSSPPPRVPIHPQIATLSTVETERMILNTTESFPGLQAGSSGCSKKESLRREQRNYKNMTRERRIEANARERTRVHTISAAFDTLRRSIPSYSNVQKLSKLSVLRIACSYIMTLSSIVNDSESSTTAECVDLVSRTIQREGKLRKKKDDND